MERILQIQIFLIPILKGGRGKIYGAYLDNSKHEANSKNKGAINSTWLSSNLIMGQFTLHMVTTGICSTQNTFHFTLNSSFCAL
jgi:hypothetical protein